MFHIGTLTRFEEKKEIQVRQYFRNGKIVRSSRRKINKAKDKPVNNFPRNLAIGGTVAVASGLGLSALTYSLLKGRYLKNLDKIIPTIKANPTLGKKMKPGVEHMTFTMGGFVGNENVENASIRIASHLHSMIPKSELSKHAIIPIKHQFTPNLKYGKEEALKKFPEFFGKSVAIASNQLKKGYNTESRKTAELLLSYAAKNPGKQINLVGHSGGGILGKEVAYILEKKGVKVKLVTAANPDLRILPTDMKSQMSFMSDIDFVSPFTRPGSIRIKSKESRVGDPHSQVTYFENETVRKNIMKHLYGSNNYVMRN